MLKNEHLERMAEKEVKLLMQYSYGNVTTDGVMKSLNEWNYNKDNLRTILRNHPNWNEEGQFVCFSNDYDRELNTEGIINMSSWLSRIANMDMFSCEDYEQMIDFSNFIRSTSVHIIGDDEIEFLDKYFPNLKARKGMKMTKIVNKFCTSKKINTITGEEKYARKSYNQMYARYCDAITPLKIKRHTIISINPIDYLTMSFGNSWSSCHTIDKKNTRNMPNNYRGCYSSGVLSYMLDGTSFMFYTVDSKYEGEEFYLQPKINRNMFHYSCLEGQNVLVQARLYPQTNDDNYDLYKDIRAIVQKVFADCLKADNLWRNKSGKDICSHFIDSKGTHYRDYVAFDSCNVSIPTKDFKDWEWEPEEAMIVGHLPICPTCGQEHNDSDNIMCYSCRDQRKICAHCGYRHDINEMRKIDGEYYCSDCCFFCDNCDEWHVGSKFRAYWDGEAKAICEDCVDDFMKCDYCGYYHKEEELKLTEEGSYYCEECIDSHTLLYELKYYEDYTYCDDCQEYFPSTMLTRINERDYCEHCFENYYIENSAECLDEDSEIA